METKNKTTSFGLYFQRVFALTLLFMVCMCVQLFAQAYKEDTLIVELTQEAIAQYNPQIDTSGNFVTIGIPAIDSLNSIWDCSLIEQLFPPPYEDSTKIFQAGLHRFYLFKLDLTDLDPDSIARIFADLQVIQSCLPSYNLEFNCTPYTVEPNDTYFNSTDQWQHLSPYAKINTYGGIWETTTGSSNIVLAILDTGVDPNHEDFAGRFVEGYNAFTEETTQQNPNAAEDVHGHGTRLAGLAAATGNNGKGIAGVCWECKIMPVKVLATSFLPPDIILARGIVWAVDHGADVINLATNVQGFACKQEVNAIVEAALKYAWDKGVSVLAASGNSQEGLECVHYPARSQYCIAVGAMSNTPPSGSRYSLSSIGPQLDFVAPGEDLKTTDIGCSDCYYSASGTSAAVAIASGVAALMKGVNPNLNPAKLRDIMRATCVDIDTLSGFDWSTGHGKLDAKAAVDEADATNVFRITNQVNGIIDYDIDPNSKVRFDSDDFGAPPKFEHFTSGTHYAESWFTKFSLTNSQQKFLNWNDRLDLYKIRHAFTPSPYASFVAVAEDIHDALVEATVLEGGVLQATTGISELEIKDPWRIEQNVQAQTQTQDDEFVGQSLPYQFINDNTTYGVFLDINSVQIDTTKPYYVFRAPFLLSYNQTSWIQQTCGGYASPIAAGCPGLSAGDLVFVDWVVDFYNGSPRALFGDDPRYSLYPDWSEFETKAVVFKKQEAQITARYKAHLLSDKPVSLTESSGPTGNNSQRKVDVCGDEHHMVYESAGEVWFSQSTNGGQTWIAELRLSSGNGTASNPSIYSSTETSVITFMEDGVLRVGRIEPDANGLIHLSKYVEYSGFLPGTAPAADAAPVIAAAKTLGYASPLLPAHTLVVYESENDNLCYLWFDGTSLTAQGVVSNSDDGIRPSLAHDLDRFMNSSSPEFHLSWWEPGAVKIYYQKITVDLSPLSVNFSLFDEVSAGAIGPPSITPSKGSGSTTTEAGIAFTVVSNDIINVHFYYRDNQGWNGPSYLSNNSPGDTAWAPSLGCIQLDERNGQSGDYMRCAFSFKSGSTRSIKVAYNNYGNWSLANQTSDALHPSVVAFPAEEKELQVHSALGSLLTESLSTIQSTNSYLTAKRRAETKPSILSEIQLTVYPNPFLESTLIRYTLHEDTFVRLFIRDYLGRTIRVLAVGEFRSGSYETTFTSGYIPNGVYICELLTSHGYKSIRIALVR